MEEVHSNEAEVEQEVVEEVEADSGEVEVEAEAEGEDFAAAEEVFEVVLEVEAAVEVGN